jgi:CRISPR-associated protein Cmr4
MMKELGLFIYTETSLHAGTGSTVSAVDLPIQRERTTRHPLVQGSGVKGALRMQVKKKDTPEFFATFGPDTNNAADHASAISVGDARIVLFPVQSLAGVFAYITCPMVLARMKRDLPAFKLDYPTPESGRAFVTNGSKVVVGGDVVLEEFSFKSDANRQVSDIAKWLAEYALPKGAEYAYWHTKLADSLVILSDGDFTEFTVNSTEIVTRIKIDSAKKTVENGALWTQELLPADTLLMSVVSVVDSRKPDFTMKAGEIAEWLRANLESVASRIQLAGDETTGNGFVAVRFVNGGGQ